MQSEIATPSSELNELEADKRKALELKKLALEIADLERPWWKRPTYILAALPTFLAVVALSVGFLNGFFSAQLTKLENQKHDLQVKVEEFEAEKDELHQRYLALEQENKTLTELTASLKNDKNKSLSRLKEALKIYQQEIQRPVLVEGTRR
jgi:hypothetical protein